MDEMENQLNVEKEIRLVIDKVLELEQSMLHISRHPGMINDIEKIVKDIVKE